MLRERVHARGVRTDLADAPLLSPLGLGSRRTTLTRAFGVPWALVSLASLGLIPLRTARESFVEVQLADRARQRVTTVRRTFVTSYWIWLPLALSPAHRFSLAENNRVDHEVDREALGRALDDALDELFSQ